MEEKQNTLHSKRSRANGRSTIEIDCPFCGATITAFIWSMAGGGKRCECGVIHYFRVSVKDK